MLAAASPSSTNGGAGGRHPSVRSSYSNELDYGRDAARAGARHKGGGKSHHSPGYGGGSRLDSRARRYSGAASERRPSERSPPRSEYAQARSEPSDRRMREKRGVSATRRGAGPGRSESRGSRASNSTNAAERSRQSHAAYAPRSRVTRPRPRPREGFGFGGGR